MKLDNKKQMILGGVVLIVLLSGLYLFVFSKKSPNKNSNSDLLPTEVVIPTVDSSVKVDLISATGGHEVKLTVKSIPNGTQTIDYELSYQTKQQGLQGAIGTVALKGESNYSKKITLGTCSSGTCVYHDVEGKIKLTLNFSGDYGRKVFQKDYQL